MRDDKPYVVIVHSDEQERARYKNMFERQLWSVSTMPDAKQTMDYLNSHQDIPEVILTQLILPGNTGSGQDLMRICQINPKYEDVPFVIIMTSAELDEVKNTSEALDHGAVDLFVEGLDERLVVRRIKSVIESQMKPRYVNVMEEALLKVFQQYSEKLGVCRCKQCTNDVITLALNRIQPRYVSSEKGRILASVEQMNRDYVPQILKVLVEAAGIINTNPRHGK